MKRYNKEDGDKPTMHSYIHVEAVTHERMQQYVTHAVAMGKTLEDLSLLGPAILQDYYRLDEISRPVALAASKAADEGCVNRGVANYMLDEIVRLTPLEDEESKKRLKVLRDGLTGAQFVYRIMGHAIRDTIQLSNTENIVNSAMEPKPEFQLHRKIMEAAMVMGPHLKNCLVEAVQTMDTNPINMSVISYLKYQDETVERIEAMLKEDPDEKEKAFIYLILFASAIMNKSRQCLSDVYKIEANPDQFTEMMKSLADTFVEKALRACQE